MLHPILNREQIREWDAYTIENQGISSYQLMESAVIALRDWITSTYEPESHSIIILCGPGNNGGDGLGLARHLFKRFYDVTILQIGTNRSSENQENWARLPENEGIRISKSLSDIPPKLIQDQTIWVDALFGTGLTRELGHPFSDIITQVNQFPGIKLAIDLPSGLQADGLWSGVVFQAQSTLSFGAPKLAFFLPEAARFVGRWYILDIGLDPEFLDTIHTDYFLQTGTDIHSLLTNRETFVHKGTMGHALLICGSQGMMGAALLAGRAALRSGTGKLTIHGPRHAQMIIQIGLPESMFQADPHNDIWTTTPDLSPYQAIGIGCGIGTNSMTQQALYSLLKSVPPLPLVLDADAINILAQHLEWLTFLPKGTILTPHPGEFKRLTGLALNGNDQLIAAQQLAIKYQLYIVLKGAFTRMIDPSGRVIFNPTGNAGMATAGSGDVLTGMITGLLAQGYSSQHAIQIGVYLHGLAGDLAVEWNGSQESILASDLIAYLGLAFNQVHNSQMA